VTLKTAWQSISVTDSNSGGMEAFLAIPSKEGVKEAEQTFPAVVVLMEIFGVNDHIQCLTQRLAEEGFVALAINYYHRQTSNLNLGYSDAEVAQGRAYKDQTRRPELMVDVKAAVEFLKTLPEVDQTAPIGTLGFCFGGHVGFVAAALPEIKRTVVCYGAGIPNFCPGEQDKTSAQYAGEIQGEILFLLGDEDPLIPESQVKALKEGVAILGDRCEMIHFPEAGHGFFCEARADYHPRSAQEGWEKLVGFLKQGVGSSVVSG
jgi:carboxymethylenebutenolidase